jgi:hypothetical protein
MAKVTGPLMSMDASGGYAGAMVFAKWKGRAYVRQLVTPANPHSADQEAARNKLRVASNGVYWAMRTALVANGETELDRALVAAEAPAGQAWNGTLVKAAIGAGGANYTAAANAWTALQAGEKTAWNNAAAALTPPIPATAQTTTGGGSTTSLVAGQTYFHYRYALYVLGIAAAPSATPPTYA